MAPTVYSSQFSSQFTVYSSQLTHSRFTVYSSQFTHSQFTVHSSQFTHSRFTVHSSRIHRSHSSYDGLTLNVAVFVTDPSFAVIVM